MVSVRKRACHFSTTQSVSCSCLERAKERTVLMVKNWQPAMNLEFWCVEDWNFFSFIQSGQPLFNFTLICTSPSFLFTYTSILNSLSSQRSASYQTIMNNHHNHQDISNYSSQWRTRKRFSTCTKPQAFLSSTHNSTDNTKDQHSPMPPVYYSNIGEGTLSKPTVGAYGPTRTTQLQVSREIEASSDAENSIGGSVPMTEFGSEDEDSAVIWKEESDEEGSTAILEENGDEDGWNSSDIHVFPSAEKKRCPRPITMMRALYWATKLNMPLTDDAKLHFKELNRVLKIGNGNEGTPISSPEKLRSVECISERVPTTKPTK